MTILFYNDWDKYPNAIVDTDTTNTSFLRMSALYRDMGIKNHSFMLSLLNPELKKLDPFDNDPSIERMMLMAIEAKNNFWWFLRTCVRVPGVGTANTSLFKANRGNLALYWLFFNHIFTTLIQIRQTGKSFSTSVLMSYLANVRCVNTQINLITKDDTLRADSLKKIKDIDDELPFFLKQRTRLDISNTEELTIKSLGNAYKGHLPNKSPKLALNVGRGLTSPIFHIDEAAFISNIAITLPAALAAGTAARDIARRNNEPYGTILTTTAGKKDDRDGKYIYQLLNESAVWTEFFFDCKDEEDLDKTIRLNSPTGKLRVNCTFNHRQLGYTDEWLKRAIEDAVSVGEDADRDFFNVWTSGSQISPLPVDITTKIRESQVNDYHTEISSPYGYVTRWYISPEEIQSKAYHSHFVMGVDSSDAAGGDDIAMVIRDIKSGAVLAAGNYNETNLITFAEWLVNWFIRFDNLTLIIERRSTGAMILDYLLLMLPAKNIDPFKRIYNKVVNDKDEYPDRFKEISKPLYARSQDIYVRYKKGFGFATSATGATSRNELYSTTLLNAGKYTGDKVYDTRTIDQLLGLVIKNGRVDHDVGEHDDLCFVGSTLVRTIDGNRPISELKVGDLVLTREGYKPILVLIASQREVITKFGITGTPDHPFITPIGQVPFKDLTLTSKVYVWDEKQLCITEKSTIDTLSLKDLSIEIISIVMKKIMRFPWLGKYVQKTVKKEPEKQLVYNLTVADCHEYFVNDILVHNCIAWLLSYWLITQGRNLDFYGIKSREILADNKLILNNNPTEYITALEQQQYRNDIENLIQQMQNERDEFIMLRLENQLRSVANKLILGSDEMFSVDDLIRNIKDRKRLTNVTQTYSRY